MAKPAVCGLDHLWQFIASDEKNSEFLKSCSLAKGNRSVEPTDKNAPTRYMLVDVDGCLDRLYGLSMVNFR